MDIGDLYMRTRSWARGVARRTGGDPEDLVDAVAEEAMAPRTPPVQGSWEDWKGRAIQAEAELAEAKKALAELRAGRPDPRVAELERDLAAANRDVDALLEHIHGLEAKRRG